VYNENNKLKGAFQIMVIKDCKDFYVTKLKPAFLAIRHDGKTVIVRKGSFAKDTYNECWEISEDKKIIRTGFKLKIVRTEKADGVIEIDTIEV
jgi:hypothetical protein